MEASKNSESQLPKAALSDDAVPAQAYERTPIVGLGGSAGAIAALQQFFRTVPTDSGLAYVVVIHLGADHDSTLAELLQRCTAMPVRQLNGTERVEPNHVYVIPPRMSIEAGAGVLRLIALPEGRAPHVAVDLFFRSLADTHGPHAAAIVLSGADGDGSIGIKRIKERGGLTVAQDPGEAEHASMPRSAIVTGMVDWVLPVEDMTRRLLSYFQLERKLVLPPEDAPAAAPDAVADGEVALREVLTYLRTRTGRDFGSYKRATVVRRIARRMQVNGTDTLQGYLQCLRSRASEAGALLQDLLISVTNFFRDAACFEALDMHMADVLKAKSAGEPLRVWVPGCATGEEAYTLAILLLERARALDVQPLIQIFGTDLNEEAIRVARDAVYPPTIEADVSDDRLRRFFVKEHRGYRVRREVREMVLFAQHDLLRDSPFSRVDLISCRNLLIYLDRSAQQRVFQTLHFASMPHARLLLGSSETVDEASGLFVVLDKKCRVFAQRPLPRPVLPAPQGSGSLGTTLHAAVAAHHPVHPRRSFESLATRALADPRLPASWGEVHFRMLESLAPPSILVDAEHDILHVSPSAGRFLQFAGGEPSRNLLRVVHPALRIEVRSALYQAAQGRHTAELMVQPVELDGAPLEVLVRANRVEESGAELFLVTLAARPMGTEKLEAQPVSVVPDPVASHLDRELERLKQHLRDTVEQYEASTEELKASNEELQAMNEELRSATEELETSREELQSINEELSTVNQELKNKVEELGAANSDMQNLINATAIAIVFLDRDLQVMRYTPSAVSLFNLIPTDVGRPLADLATRLKYPDLWADAMHVLDSLVPIEREVGLPDGRWFLARLLPYRTMDDRIAGLVLSFIDITERKQAEEMRLWLSAVVNSSGDAILSFALDGTVLSWNGGAEAVFNYSAGEMIGQPLSRLFIDADAERALRDGEVGHGRSVGEPDLRLARKGGSSVHVSLSLSPIKDADGRIIGGTAIARDISEFRRATQALRESEERMRLVVENSTEFAIFSVDLGRRITVWNVGAERLLGYGEQEVLGRTADLIFTPEDRQAGVPEQEAATALAEGRAMDDRWHMRKDGSRFWASGASMLMRNASGEAIGFVKILRDQTTARDAQQALEHSQRELTQALATNERQRSELESADAAKDRFMAVLSHELRNPLASIGSAGELINQTAVSEADRARAGEVVQRQAASMRALLDDLLDVSRLRLGRLEFHRRPVGITQVIRSALESTAALVAASGHELTVALPANELEVDGDPLRLAQVVGNLLTNAVKYTPRGGHIEVSAQLAEGEVVVAVQDDGIGMARKELETMFDMFSQAPEAMERASGGLGIGLALSRSIVEAHGGWIRASSPGHGHGSVFRFGLPLLRATRARTQELKETVPVVEAPDAAEVAGQGELVLVVDDNADITWSLALLLETSGWRTLTAHGGFEALQLAEQHLPQAIVLDVGMADLDGREVARRVRAAPWGKRMVLVAATGWGQEQDVRQSLAAGFDAHLTKPIDADQLQRLIRDQLASR